MTTNTTGTGTEVRELFLFPNPPNVFAVEAGARRGRNRGLEFKPRTEDPFGLYLIYLSAAQRCKFCYFKVYTQNAGEIELYT